MIEAQSAAGPSRVQTHPTVARLRSLLTLRVRLAVLMAVVITGVVGLAAYLETRQFESSYLNGLVTQVDIAVGRWLGGSRCEVGGRVGLNESGHGCCARYPASPVPTPRHP